MKQLYVFIVLGIITIPVFSQPHPKTKELADSVAAVMCRCMNDTFLGIEEDVKNLIANAINDPENGPMAIQNYLAEAGEEKASEIVEQLQKLGSIDSDLTLCFSESTERFKNLQTELEGLSEEEQRLVAFDFESEQKTIALLMDSMGTRSDCNFAYHFIKLGLDLTQK